MSTIAVNSEAADDVRREQIYSGQLFAYSPRPSSLGLVDHAWDLIREAFDPIDPSGAQDHLPVERFVEIIAPLKTTFTHDLRSKQRLSELLADFGCDLGRTYFDLPKLRIVSHSGYLTAGVGYAYKPHRDTWYSAPPSQHNWWLPITNIATQSALAFHPQYWEQPVPNSSGGFDPYEWNAGGRADAAKHVKTDTRNHPAPTEPIDLDHDTRIIGSRGSLIIFSAAHLHSTVPNQSGQTRFSIDFRTAHLDDLLSRAGAANVDSDSTGTTLRDFLRADDFSPLPEDVIESYDVGSKHRGSLVFQPPGAV